MKYLIALVITLLIYSCSTPYMVYTADVYLADKRLCKDAVVRDYGTPGKLFFYDNNHIGHYIVGEITVKNSTDTVFIK